MRYERRPFQTGNKARAGGFGNAGNFGGNRHEFAAMEPEIAQDARIKLTQRGESRSDLLTVFPPGNHSPTKIANRLQRRADDFAELVRAMRSREVVKLAARQN